MRDSGVSEAALVFLVAALAAVLLTAPLAFRLDRASRVNTDDGKWSIWVVAWVSRTLVADPSHVFDANIFYPHRNALAFSESNLGAGAIALPVYWATRNPFAAHNSAVLIGFTLSGAGMYFLTRRLTGNRAAAALGALLFAYCPHVFSKMAHVQLLMTAGLPWTLLAFHRLVDGPSPLRAATLGLTLAATALTCAYYGVFATLILGYGTIFYAASRRLYRDTRLLAHLALAAAIAILAILPAVLPYRELQRETGFARSLEDARMYSADWRSYLVSSAWAHRWMLERLRPWNEVLFPGFVAVALGSVGVWQGFRARGTLRETTAFYASLGALALWASFGPDAGLYSAFYYLVPPFSLLRAPARMGLIVALALAVLAAVALAASLRGADLKVGRPKARRHPATAPRHLATAWRYLAINRQYLVAAALALAVVDLVQYPLIFPDAPPFPSPYRVFAALPRGAVVEFPFYSRRSDYPRHAQYMLFSTAHWQPLVNGYSDFIPSDFRADAASLDTFPSRKAFAVLERRRTRYFVIHDNLYDHRFLPVMRERLAGEFAPYVKLLAEGDRVWLYQIVGWPR